jgi:hypothetical protein
MNPFPRRFICGDLQAVIVTVRTCRKLRYCAESAIRRLRIGKRRKTTRTDRLMAVHLCKIWLVYRAVPAYCAWMLAVDPN